MADLVHLLSGARLPRSVGCREDHQCPAGFFCEVPRLSCRPCLSCDQLNRHPRYGNTTSCITSITACGACFAGLVPIQGDNKCWSPSEGQPLLLPYEWAVIAVSLLFAVIICAAAVYVLRNFDAFKILASTRTLVHSPVDVEASAPQLPPPYNDATTALSNQTCNDDERTAFIKPIPTPPAEVRERLGYQSARVFNNPTYVRTVQPPGYEESPDVQGELAATSQDTTNTNSSQHSTNSANAMTVSGIEESTGKDVQLNITPSDMLLLDRQDRNNNSGSYEETDYTSTHGGTAFIINVIRNVNTVQQRNDLRL